MKNSDLLKENLKRITPEEMRNHGIVSPARNGGYICPFCGNGSGDDGTGIEPGELSGGYEYHCFKCDESADNIKLLAEHYHLHEKNDFKEILERATAEFNLSDIEPYIPVRDSLEEKDVPKDKWKSIILSANKNLAKLPEDKRRGLTLETLHYFFCGYFSDYAGGPRLIIPTSFNHFLARLTVPIEDLPKDTYTARGGKEKKIAEKQHFGSKEIFNLKAAVDTDDLIFVVEGEIDAMSIYQAGFVAISIGGSSLSANMKAELQTKLKPGKKFIVMLDNDDTGRKKAAEVVSVLNNLGFYAVKTILSNIYKDANDFLRADPEGFKKALQAKYDEGKKKFDDMENRGLSALSDEPEIHSRKSTAQIFPNCPIDLLIPPGFSVDKYGVYNGGGKKITSVPLLVTEEIHNASSREVSVKIIRYDTRKKIFKSVGIFEASVIASAQKINILNNYGAGIAQSNMKAMADFLTELRFNGNEERIPMKTTFIKPGYNEDFTEFYYPPEGDEYIFDDSWFPFKDLYSVKGDADTWLAMFKKVIRTSATARITIGAALAAPLVHPLGIRNQQLHLACPSGSGKSAATKFAASIFGNPEGMFFNFNGTLNSLETLAIRSNCLPSFVEELQSIKKIAREEIDVITYRFEIGDTRSRNKKDNKLQDREHFHGVRLYTGEQDMVNDFSGAGAISRLLTIKLPNVFENDFAVDIHHFVTEHFGLFGRRWVNYIIKHKDEIKQSQKDLEEIYSSRAGHLMPNHIAAISLFHTALYHFAEMLGTDAQEIIGTLTSEDFTEIAANLPTKNNSSNADRALQVIAESIFTHRRYFKVERYIEGNLKFVASEDGWANETYGLIFSDGSVGFYPQQLKKKILADFPDANAIITALAVKDVLIHDDDPSRPYQKRFNKLDGKNTQRLYVFKPEIFNR